MNKRTWLAKALVDRNVKPQNPIKKSTPDIVKRIGGTYLNQSCKKRKSRLRDGRRYSGDWCTRTPSKLFVADAILSTNEANQQTFTIVEEMVLSADWKENCKVVAVMLEKKMAIRLYRGFADGDIKRAYSDRPCDRRPHIIICRVRLSMVVGRGKGDERGEKAAGKGRTSSGRLTS